MQISIHWADQLIKDESLHISSEGHWMTVLLLWRVPSHSWDLEHPVLGTCLWDDTVSLEVCVPHASLPTKDSMQPRLGPKNWTLRCPPCPQPCLPCRSRSERHALKTKDDLEKETPWLFLSVSQGSIYSICWYLDYQIIYIWEGDCCERQKICLNAWHFFLQILLIQI